MPKAIVGKLLNMNNSILLFPKTRKYLLKLFW